MAGVQRGCRSPCRIAAGMLGLGRGWEEKQLGLGSVAHAVMHSTINWSQQEEWLEPGLCTG